MYSLDVWGRGMFFGLRRVRGLFRELFRVLSALGGSLYVHRLVVSYSVAVFGGTGRLPTVVSAHDCLKHTRNYVTRPRT